MERWTSRGATHLKEQFGQLRDQTPSNWPTYIANLQIRDEVPPPGEERAECGVGWLLTVESPMFSGVELSRDKEVRRSLAWQTLLFGVQVQLDVGFEDPYADQPQRLRLAEVWTQRLVQRFRDTTQSTIKPRKQQTEAVNDEEVEVDSGDEEKENEALKACRDPGTLKVALTVRTLTGTEIKLSVPAQLNLNGKEVKMLIKAEQGILVKHQRLNFRGLEFPDDARLDRFGVDHNSTIHLILKGPIPPSSDEPLLTAPALPSVTRRKDTRVLSDRILVETEHLRLRHIIALEADAELEALLVDAPVNNIVNLIDVKASSKKRGESFGAPKCYFRLEREVRDHGEDLGPESQNFLDSTDHSFCGKKYEITVKKNFMDRTMIFHVSTMDMTITDLKRMVKEKEGIPVCFQELYFCGNPLENERTLSECNIQKQCTLYLGIMRRYCGGRDLLGHESIPGILKQKSAADNILQNFLQPSIWGDNSSGESTRTCSSCRHEMLFTEDVVEAMRALHASSITSSSASSGSPSLEEMCQDGAFHWYARCAHPSAFTLWTPETDRYWPLMFRKIVRYCLQIQVQGQGELKHLPHDVVTVIALYL